MIVAPSLFASRRAKKAVDRTAETRSALPLGSHAAAWEPGNLQGLLTRCYAGLLSIPARGLGAGDFRPCGVSLQSVSVAWATPFSAAT